MPEPANLSDNATLQAQIQDLQARVSALESRAFTAPVKAATSAKTSDSFFGLTLVNRVGALTLALGVLFFFKYAAENGWIGPTARVLLGLLIGIVLVASSEWIDRRQGRMLSQGLAGCGLATIFISLYASYGYYHLVGAALAFLLLLVLCQAAIAVAWVRKNEAMAALALLGALLIPALIELTRPGTWRTVQAVYLVLLQGQALAVAVKQDSRAITILSAVAIAMAALLQIGSGHAWTFLLLALSLALTHFVAWKAARSAASVSLTAYPIGHCFIVMAGLRLLPEWTSNPATASTLGSVLLAIYGIALLASGLTRGAGVNRTLGLSFLGLVIAKLYLYDIWQLNYAARISAFVILGALLLGASFLYRRTRSHGRS